MSKTARLKIIKHYWQKLYSTWVDGYNISMDRKFQHWKNNSFQIDL